MNNSTTPVFDVVSKILNTVSQSLEIPVIILLILLIAAALLMIGWVISEYFTEHRHMKLKLPELMDEIRSDIKPVGEVIEESGLLKTQKTALIEITKHPEFTEVMRESLADNLIEEEQSRYDKTLKITNLMAKLGPTLGLMGTLIPLGPGIIALGQGDTYTLSTSLLTAFNTTIAGLCVAAIAICISTVRGGWYGKYMSILETVMDSILEMQKLKDVPQVSVDISKMSSQQMEVLENRILTQTFKEATISRRDRMKAAKEIKRKPDGRKA
ncbi:MAG: MotA/TolQ/ExbB proton channel family protein [Lentihominibacter sp.]|jgi:biopolymer transport protein ExbB/TolQ